MSKSLLSTGLKLKPTYDQLLDYLQRDPDRIHYPNRNAIILRNSFQLSQLDGINDLDMARFNQRLAIEEHKEQLLKQFARDFNLKIPEVRGFIRLKGLSPVALPGRPPANPVAVAEDVEVPVDLGVGEEHGMPTGLGVGEEAAPSLVEGLPSRSSHSNPILAGVGKGNGKGKSVIPSTANSGGVTSEINLPTHGRGSSSSSGMVSAAIETIEDAAAIAGA